MGRGSEKTSLSCADSNFPVEACRWPGVLLSLPGRAETAEKKGLGAEGRLPACWSGRSTQSWEVGGEGEVVGSPPCKSPDETRGVLSGSHAVS